MNCSAKSIRVASHKTSDTCITSRSRRSSGDMAASRYKCIAIALHRSTKSWLSRHQNKSDRSMPSSKHWDLTDTGKGATHGYRHEHVNSQQGACMYFRPAVRAENKGRPDGMGQAYRSPLAAPIGNPVSAFLAGLADHFPSGSWS